MRKIYLILDLGLWVQYPTLTLRDPSTHPGPNLSIRPVPSLSIRPDPFHSIRPEPNPSPPWQIRM